MRTAGRFLARAAGVALPVLAFAGVAGAEVGVWRVTGGFSTLTISESQLASVGLALDHAVPTAEEKTPAVPGVARWSFSIPEGGDLTFRARNGLFRGFVEASPTFRHRGGLVLRLDSGSRAATGLSLLDFSVELVSGVEMVSGRIRSADGASPFEIRNSPPAFHAEGPSVAIHGGDLMISEEWARAVGRPEIAGEWVGAFDLRLNAEFVRREASVEPVRDPEPQVEGIDVLLAQVFDMRDLGRTGTYPDGELGISFATTSCNNGSVEVPWHAPMAEDHPFIGLIMCREKDGRLEMIGKSWLKHGFFALSSNDCQLGCVATSGGTLGVGCSDVYSVYNNGSQFYLGPREEVNPHTCVWNCLGSWFDGTPVDCVRNEDGSGLDGVAHRLAVLEQDLLTPGATYYYEGVYYVMDDVDVDNNFMWREVTPNWNGADWTFSDVGGGLEGTPGPLIYAWGDQHSASAVAPDDGKVVLATQVTDLGGGQWHYEYAVYNQTSGRGIDQLTIPVGTASVSGAGFRDHDRDAGSDWAFTLDTGFAKWSTGAYGGAEPAYPLTYQSIFNFWFDADAPPQNVTAELHVHAPGNGSVALFSTQSPGDATGVIEPELSAAALKLFPVEPNPFTSSTRVAFSLGRERRVRLTVVDVSGRLVARLLDGAVPSGRTALHWNGRDATGREVASGIYFFRLESGQDSRTTKGILLR